MIEKRNTQSFKRELTVGVLKIVVAVLFIFVSTVCIASSTSGDGKDLKQKGNPIDPTSIPDRPNLLIEWGEGLFEIGEFREPLQLPTGAVWSPALWVFGGYHVAHHYQSNGRLGDGNDNHVITNRLDLFANLRLSGTERILIGFRPTDDVYSNPPQFTHYDFSPGSGKDKLNTEFNADINTLFFEGDFGELFPTLDHADSRALDIGFSVGRQQISIQDGILLNDNIDTIGLIQNTILTRSTNNISVTALFAWNQINRGARTILDDSARLYGIFSDLETFNHSIEFDLIYMDDTSDLIEGLFAGLSSTQRIRSLNSTFRAVGSYQTKDDALPGSVESGSIDTGALFTSELSITPHGGHDLVYFNAFYGLDKYTPAARGNGVGGAIANMGILFAGVGIGPYVSPLDNNPQDTYGFALGYQLLFAHGRRQLIFEYGFKQNEDINDNQAIGARLQQALGQHYIIQLDAYYSKVENLDDGLGTRAALRVKF